MFSPRKMTHTLRACALLIGYPDASLRGLLPDLRLALHDEAALSASRLAELDALIDTLQQQPALDGEAAYVELFDRGRSTSLHLFEHVHGDSRDRGQAMVDLHQVYAAGGFELGPRELPDYLPAMLEFLSHRPLDEAREMLRDCAHILRSIGCALRERGSAYAVVFDALLVAVGEDGLGAAIDTIPSDEPDIDVLWAEAPAFGPASGNASCSAAASGRGCTPPAA